MPLPKNPLKTAALAAASLAIALIVVEGALRILDPDTNPSASWHSHPVLGWTHNPRQSDEYHAFGETVREAYNSKGFLDIEHELEKPPDVRRIVVLGDSFSAAAGVNLEDSFVRRLDQILYARTSAEWQVINLGVGDFGTGQQWLALEHHGLAYDPDIVVHQIFPLNDVCNNSVDLAGLCKSRKDPYRPYFVEAGDGELQPASAQPWRAALRRHLTLYRLAEKAYRRLAGKNEETIDEAEYRERLDRAGLPELVPLL